MGEYLQEAVLPVQYDNYVFDLYGTLVDIHTEEDFPKLWEKLALFFGYYGAIYEPKELQKRYAALVSDCERALKKTLEEDRHYTHEASPEIEIGEVFEKLYQEKGIVADKTLAIHTGQFFRALSTDYVRLYPGTKQMLASLKKIGKKVYLLSNAQRIFTAYEMNVLGITPFFDDILISSDYHTKKPDERFFHILLERHKLDEAIHYQSDVKVLSAKHWPTPITLAEFSQSTQTDSFPIYLNQYIKNDVLEVMANGSLNYTVKGIYMGMKVTWNYMPPVHGGDTFTSIKKGSKATLKIVQNEKNGFVKELYIQKKPNIDSHAFETQLQKTIEQLQESYPFLSVKNKSNGIYLIDIPQEYRLGHEEHFSKVAKAFLHYIRNKNIPEWENENTLTKYYITTTAVEMAKKENK